MDFCLSNLFFGNKPVNKPVVEVENKPEVEVENKHEVDIDDKPVVKVDDAEAKVNAKKIKLQIIVNKLNEIPEFANKYDIKLNNIFSWSPCVRVMHKEKPKQEKYVYNPSIDSIDIEYRTDNSFCYDIRYDESGFGGFYKTISIIPKTLIPFHTTDSGMPSRKIEHYNKNVNFEDIDYADIVNYITTSDLTMWWKTTQNYLASNEWLCSKCNSKCNTVCK